MSNIHTLEPKGGQEFREVAGSDTGSPRSTMNRSVEELTEHYTMRPNAWASWRMYYREAAAEFLGTMFVILFGDGVVCQVSTHLFDFRIRC